MLVDRDVEKGKLKKVFSHFIFYHVLLYPLNFTGINSKRTKNTCIRAYFFVSHNISYDDYLNSFSYHRSPAVWARERRNTIVARRNKNDNSIITPTHGTRSKSKKRSIDKIRLVP